MTAPDSFGSPDGRTYSGPALPPLPPKWTGKYRERPVVVEAVQLVDDLRNHTAVATWITVNGGVVDIPFAEPCLFIQTMEGRMRADIGDWIIKGVAGEFYPVRADIFAETYEPAGAQPVPLRSDAETAAMLRADLADAEAQLARWPRCPSGCSCRIGIEGDADANECGCDGPCNGGAQPEAGPCPGCESLRRQCSELAGEVGMLAGALTGIRDNNHPHGSWSRRRARAALDLLHRMASAENPDDPSLAARF